MAAIGYTKIGGTVHEIGPGAGDNWVDISTQTISATLSSALADSKTSTFTIFDSSGLDLSGYSKVRYIVNLTGVTLVSAGDGTGTVNLNGSRIAGTGSYMGNPTVGTHTSAPFLSANKTAGYGEPFYLPTTEKFGDLRATFTGPLGKNSTITGTIKAQGVQV